MSLALAATLWFIWRRLLVDNWLRRIKPKLCTILCAGLLMLFVCDEVYSAAHPNQGKGVSTPTAAMQDVGETEGKDHV